VTRRVFNDGTFVVNEIDDEDDGMSADMDEQFDAEQIMNRLTQQEKEMLRCGEVTPKEAHEILVRFCHSHFRGRFGDNVKEQARITIPADPRRDDDLRLSAFIERAALAMQDREQIRLEATLEERARIVRAVDATFASDGPVTRGVIVNAIGEPPPSKYLFMAELVDHVNQMQNRVQEIRASFERLGRELGLR
jgi:hypothetical protein